MKVLDIGVRYDLRDMEREAEMPPEAPVVIRPMSEEEWQKYGPPARPTRAEVRERLARGMSAAAIAAEFGASEKRLKKLAETMAHQDFREGQHLKRRQEQHMSEIETPPAEDREEATEMQEAMDAREQPETRTSGQPPAATKPELTKEALEAAIAEGKTNNEICAEFGVSRSTLYIRMKQWGLLSKDPTASRMARQQALRATLEALKSSRPPAGAPALEQAVPTCRVTLASGGEVTLTAAVNIMDLSPDERTFLFGLIDAMKGYGRAAS